MNRTEDITIYYPLKCSGKYTPIAYSFSGILLSFSNAKDIFNFINASFLTESECEERCSFLNGLSQKSNKIEEKALKAFPEYCCNDNIEEEKALRNGFIEGYHQAEKDLKSPWIPASNPPDDDRLVFICVNDNGVPQCVGCGCYKQGVWVDAEDKLDYPDYWMEIPELPKEN